MKETFGILPSGENTSIYTISCGGLTAAVTDYGAALVKLLVPDRDGVLADVVLGYDDCNGYRTGTCFLGATVGRSANRIQGSSFSIGEKTFTMTPNEGANNLHSGPDFYHNRMWKVLSHDEDAITLELRSPNGDQGFPGNAVIKVTYQLDSEGGLHIIYDAICDQDTIFNLTNHSYFNLAGQDKVDAAMDQILSLPGRFFNPDNAENIPTGELRSVAGTPMDFRSPKPIGRDISEDYDALNLQGGYDHNWEVFCNPCAQLSDPESGRIMAVYTDCPGVQFYAGNFLKETGKGGVYYGKRSGICLETQYYPDSIHHPEWPQPITKAGKKYHSETVYRFTTVQ
jgi:aldose 1-epimerase